MFILQAISSLGFWFFMLFISVILAVVTDISNEKYSKIAENAMLCIFIAAIVGIATISIGLCTGYNGAYDVTENSTKKIIVSESESFLEPPETEATVIPKDELTKKQWRALALAKSVDLSENKETGEVECIAYTIFSQGVDIGNVEVVIHQNIDDFAND